MKISMVFVFLFLVLSIRPADAQVDTVSADPVKIKKINPTGALFRSAFVPGWGQIYNKQYIKAALIAGVEIYLINGVYTHWKDADRHKKNFTNPELSEEYRNSEFAEYEKAVDSRGTHSWFLAATIFFSMFDAYVDAHLSNFDQEDKAFEVNIGVDEEEEIKIMLSFNIL